MGRSTIALALLSLLACAAVSQAENAETVNKKHHGGYEKYHHEDPHHEWPVCNKVCACVKVLQPIPLIGQHGCNKAATCTGSNPGAVCFDQGCPGGGGASYTCTTTPPPPNYAFCDFDTAQLCFQVSCPSDGTITIHAEALKCCEGTANGLQLYTGLGYNPANIASAFKSGDIINYTGSCSKGDVYTVCEKQNVINLDTLSFTFGGGAFEVACPAGLTSLGCTTPALHNTCT